IGSSWYSKNKKNHGRKSHDGRIYVGGSLFQVNPDGSDLQVYTHNMRNTYEQSMNSFGDMFHSDNDDTESCRTSFAMKYGNSGFSSADGSRSWRADMRPGQAIPSAHWRQLDPGVMPAGDIYGTGAPAGMTFYENGALPAKYRGLMIVCESARNTLLGYYPKEDKAGFELKNFDFMTSNTSKQFAGTDFLNRKIIGELKTWFRPSDVTVGADGALYVTDWFDSRVGGHQSMDDKGTGTIYRIAPKGFKSQTPQFNLETIDGAITALKSPAVNVRYLGFRALNSFGAKAIDAVKKLLQDDNVFIRARAVWVLAELGDTTTLTALLKDQELCTVAARALLQTKPNSRELLEELSTHSSAAVRREAAIATRDLSFEEAKQVIINLAQNLNAQDRTSIEAFGKACEGKEEQCYNLLVQKLQQSKPLQWDEQFQQIAWRLHALSSLQQQKERALADLPFNERKLSVDAIAFMKERQAAEAMLFIARNCKDDLYPTALYWLKHRKNNDWKPYDQSKDINSLNRQVSVVEVKQKALFTVNDIKLSAQALRGKNLFLGRGTCFVCHKFGDQGRDIGPDLSLIGAKYSPSIIKEAIVNPSSAIVFNYELIEVTKKDGSLLQGFLIADTDPLILKDISGSLVEIPLSEIAKRHTSDKSLMPSAKALNLKEKDRDDIASFLIETADQVK
ncbi:MAG: c-type cytochrome, partial [Lentisphaeraceae bacterium]|nr:c-type cytochrome [Lentisphaeraceae bacterium]